MKAGMFSYVLKRTLHVVPVLLGITIIAFLLGVLSPGDPATVALSLGDGASGSPEQIEVLKKKYGIDRSKYVQYFSWLRCVAAGDMGSSYITGKSILDDLTLRLPVTLKLTGVTTLFMMLFGFGIGGAQFFSSGLMTGHVFRFINSLFISLPEFSIAFFLINVFSENLGLLPTSGVDGWTSYILPALTISLPAAAVLAPLITASLKKESYEYFVVIARAKGLGGASVFFRHILKPAMIPVVAFWGMHVGGLLAGAAIAESIFSLPGLGHYALDAILRRDYPCLQGYVLFSGFVFVMVNLLTDIALHLLNPKVCMGEGD